MGFLNFVDGMLSISSYRTVDAKATTIDDILKSVEYTTQKLTASFDDVDRNAGDATTVYWFIYYDTIFGLSITDDGTKSLVDSEGYPIEHAIDTALQMLLEC